MITYKDFPSGKIRRTRGTFLGWIRGGEFGFIYAVVQRKVTTLYIPRQDIAADSLELLPSVPNPVPTELRTDSSEPAQEPEPVLIEIEV
jgi:hypothetical protein